MDLLLMKPLPLSLLLILGLPLWVGFWLCWHSHGQWESTQENGKSRAVVCRDYLPGK